MALDGIDRLVVFSGGIFIAGPENGKCNYGHAGERQIATSMKFVLNTAQIPLLEYSELEATLPPYQLLPPDSDNSPEAMETRRLLEVRKRGLNTPTLLVSGDVLATSGGSVYQIEVEISEHVKPTRLLYSGKPFSGSVPLWSAGYYGVTPASDLTDTLSERVEAALKEFVNDRAEDIRQAEEMRALGDPYAGVGREPVDGPWQKYQQQPSVEAPSAE